MTLKILIVAAHPDDEILGCGGTVARMIREGSSVSTLILGEGVTSRDDVRDEAGRHRELQALQQQIRAAGGVIGIEDITTEHFPDNRFDSVPLLDIVKTVEKVKNRVQPDIIFTHYENDLNIDHRITYRAVLTAARPLVGESVREIYSFEIPSSTEWNYPLSFSPDTFYDIGETLSLKLDALSCYRGEMRSYPHPRSLEGIELLARNWGMKIGRTHAEAFKVVRQIR